MQSLSPTTAALEGFRLIRREPWAILVWTLLWVAAFTVTAFVLASGERISVASHGDYRSVGDIARRFGPFAAVFITLFLLVWATTTIATYRAVLRPHDRAWFYLRLGYDEWRLALMTVVAFFVVLAFGGAPAYLLFVIVNPILRAVPQFARDIAPVGALATVCLDIWLGVRLSLIAVETFAERRFHLTAYWPLTRGRFWYLIGCYGICFLFFFVLTLVVFILGEFVFQTATLRIGAGGLLWRASVLALAGILTLLTSGFFVASSTLFCACQAYAYRAVVGAGKAGVTPV
jgi:hypothetical protein